MTLTAVPAVRVRRRATPGIGATAAGLSLLIVTVLWVGNGGLRDLTGGHAVTAIGRLTGQYASDLLLIQVLLMARIPAVERAFGQDRLARWHLWTGFSPRHDEISARSLPQLVEATLGAQGADIDSVSGATYTSGGYRESLQSAIDAARL
ncbi:FMN-binding protein [Actinoplanes sp. NPDC023801]|uniref:FMN-binding protein n=1 Tax=Actinoplanes sp. NPDC023801 TaxID=3154595 RepID=UPI0033C3B2DA